MVVEHVEPVQLSYTVVGHRENNVLLLEASFDLREALAVGSGEDEIAELENQAA